VTSLEAATTIDTGQNQPLSLKSVVESTQVTLAALNDAITAYAAELAAIKAITDDIVAVKTTVDAMNKRLTDVEALLADLSDEVKQARKEYASDPSKRLIDKIDSMDSEILALQQTTAALEKEIVDARSADRFDTLAERLGSIESSIESIQDALNNLAGRGNVNGLRVGRSILHGEVELIPGSNIAITRERNGYRFDIVDNGTCVDLGAPKIDPNNCCGNGNPNFGN
jgi:chromosome segregation ATPase